MVPVHVIGKSKGEKLGGQLQIIRHELEVVCLPANIPTSIDIDVAELDIGDVVHIEDVRLPVGIEVPHEVNFTVITVTGHKAEETARLPLKRQKSSCGCGCLEADRRPGQPGRALRRDASQHRLHGGLPGGRASRGRAQAAGYQGVYGVGRLAGEEAAAAAPADLS